MKEKVDVILASQSPRRKELLGQLGIPFSIKPSDVEEKTAHQDPYKMVCDLSEIKGRDIFQRELEKSRTHFLVISADTLVCLNDRVFGKPQDENEAREFLETLGGQTHQVLSGVSLFFQNLEGSTFTKTFAVQTDVEFSPLNDELIDLYISTGDSLDKAGAYGIQGPSSLFVKSLRGSYSNVVGFPLVEFLNELESLMRKAGLWMETGYPLATLFGEAK